MPFTYVIAAIAYLAAMILIGCRKMQASPEGDGITAGLPHAESTCERVGKNSRDQVGATLAVALTGLNELHKINLCL